MAQGLREFVDKYGSEPKQPSMNEFVNQYGTNKKQGGKPSQQQTQPVQQQKQQPLNAADALADVAGRITRAAADKKGTDLNKQRSSLMNQRRRYRPPRSGRPPRSRSGG